jgi:hypothetical protein
VVVATLLVAVGHVPSGVACSSTAYATPSKRRAGNADRKSPKGFASGPDV